MPNISLNAEEAKFLLHCVDAFAEAPQHKQPGRPLMFTEHNGEYEQVLLTADQIAKLYVRIKFSQESSS
jgi:hypothetical protein